MRDVNRIDVLLAGIKEVWMASPDLRLCQLLSKLAVDSGWNSIDLFFLEDDVLIKQIEEQKHAIL